MTAETYKTVIPELRFLGHLCLIIDDDGSLWRRLPKIIDGKKVKTLLPREQLVQETADMAAQGFLDFGYFSTHESTPPWQNQKATAEWRVVWNLLTTAENKTDPWGGYANIARDTKAAMELGWKSKMLLSVSCPDEKSTTDLVPRL